MTAWHLFLREVLIRVRLKRDEVGMGVHQKMVLPVTNFGKQGPSPTVCFINLLLNPTSPIFFPVISSLHPHSPLPLSFTRFLALPLGKLQTFFSSLLVSSAASHSCVQETLL